MESQDERYGREKSYSADYERRKSIGEETFCKRIIRNILYDQSITIHGIRKISGLNFEEIIELDKEITAARIGENMLSKLIKSMIDDGKGIQDIKSVITSHQSIMENYEKYGISYGIMKEENVETELENIRRHEWNQRIIGK